MSDATGTAPGAHDPPDPERHARRAARRDARAARDHGDGAGVFERRRLRRGADARARVRGRRSRAATCAARRPPTACSTSRARARAALRHDRADRAARRDALRRRPSRRCASATSRTPTAACARSAASRASSCRPASSWSARRRRRGRPRRSRCCATCSTRSGCGLPHRPRRRRPLPGAARRPRRARGGARADPARARRRATSSAWSARSRALGLGDAAAELLVRVPQLRGGPEVLDGLDGHAGEAARGPARRARAAAPRVAERVIFDLGLVRSLGYYTGAIFQVYDPALGVPLGGGGRYDDLLGRFGRPLPAVGFALNVERLHIALAGEERGERSARERRRRPDDRGPARRAVRARRSTCSTRSASTRARCARTTASCCSATSGS